MVDRRLRQLEQAVKPEGSMIYAWTWDNDRYNIGDGRTYTLAELQALEAAGSGLTIIVLRYVDKSENVSAPKAE